MWRHEMPSHTKNWMQEGNRKLNEWKVVRQRSTKGIFLKNNNKKHTQNNKKKTSRMILQHKRNQIIPFRAETVFVTSCSTKGVSMSLNLWWAACAHSLLRGARNEAILTSWEVLETCFLCMFQFLICVLSPMQQLYCPASSPSIPQGCWWRQSGCHKGMQAPHT